MNKILVELSPAAYQFCAGAIALMEASICYNGPQTIIDGSKLIASQAIKHLAGGNTAEVQRELHEQFAPFADRGLDPLGESLLGG